MLTPAQNIEILQKLGWRVAIHKRGHPLINRKGTDCYQLVMPSGYIYSGEYGAITSMDEILKRAPCVSTDLQITMIEIPAWLNSRGAEFILSRYPGSKYFYAELYAVTEEGRGTQWKAGDEHPAAAIASAFYQLIQTLK